MVKFPTDNRVECLNQIRPGKICGAHLTEGTTFCPVCGEKTTTRRISSVYEVVQNPPYVRRDWTTRP